VLNQALHGAPADPDAARRFHSALAAFEQQVERLIDMRERRDFGLQLHLVLAEIRHMGWRVDSLARLCGQG